MPISSKFYFSSNSGGGIRAGERGLGVGKSPESGGSLSVSGRSAIVEMSSDRQNRLAVVDGNLRGSHTNLARVLRRVSPTPVKSGGFCLPGRL